MLFLGPKHSGLRVKLIRRQKNTFFVYITQTGEIKTFCGSETKSLQTQFLGHGSPCLPQNLQTLPRPLDATFTVPFRWFALFFTLASVQEQELVSKSRANDDFCIGRYVRSQNCIDQNGLKVPLSSTNFRKASS